MIVSNGYVSTNEFTVKEGMEEHLKYILDNICFKGTIETDVFKRNGYTYGWFRCFGSISGLVLKEYDSEEDMIDDEYNEFDIMIEELQKCVREDDYIQIFIMKYQDSRYSLGGSFILTSTEATYIDILLEGRETARKILNKA